MAEGHDSWLKSRADAAWDPYEVWKERVLRPRLGNALANPVQPKLADHVDAAKRRSGGDSDTAAGLAANRERLVGSNSGARGRT